MFSDMSELMGQVLPIAESQKSPAYGSLIQSLTHSADPSRNYMVLVGELKLRLTIMCCFNVNTIRNA